VLQCVAVCCRQVCTCHVYTMVVSSVATASDALPRNVLQCVAVCCNVLQCVAVCCSVLKPGVYVSCIYGGVECSDCF